MTPQPRKQKRVNNRHRSRSRLAAVLNFGIFKSYDLAHRLTFSCPENRSPTNPSRKPQGHDLRLLIFHFPILPWLPSAKDRSSLRTDWARCTGSGGGCGPIKTPERSIRKVFRDSPGRRRRNQKMAIIICHW